MVEKNRDERRPSLVEIKSPSSSARRREERRMLEESGRESKAWEIERERVFVRERWEGVGDGRRASVASSGVSRRGSREERGRDGKIVLVVG